MNYLLGSTAAFLCDYAAKEKVEKTYDEKKQKELFHGKVQIEKYHNRGAALNALAKRPELMKKLHAGVWFTVAGYLVCLNRHREHAGMKAGTGLLLAGGLNNLLERYRRGYVVDYIRLKTPNKRLNKLVFNLSDIYVLIGAVILFITSRLHKDEQ